MEKTIWTGSLRGPNLKSKTSTEPRRSIQNLKWAGIFAIVLTIVFGGAVAEAQQPKKIPRIGFVSVSGNLNTPGAGVQAFQQGLRDFGYDEMVRDKATDSFGFSISGGT